MVEKQLTKIEVELSKTSQSNISKCISSQKVGT